MKKSEQDKRTHVVKVRFNDEEYEKIQKISEMPVAKYIRLKSLENPMVRLYSPTPRRIMVICYTTPLKEFD